MKEQILHLDPHDDFNSARDKIGWTQTARVLLVWPARGRVLTRRLDLLLLYRHARQLGAHLALVTQDSAVREHARDLGLPVFASIGGSRRGRWRTRPAQPRLQRRQPRAALEALQAARRPARLRLPVWLVWLLKSLVFAAGIGGLAALAYALVPAATVTLNPAIHPLVTTVEIVADPDLRQVEAPHIPARTLRVELEKGGLAPTTGLKNVPTTPARAMAVFTNLSGVATTIPQGVGVRTTSGAPVRFKTLKAAAVDGRIGATASVEVEAVDLGPVGNVGAGLINAIDGPLGLHLAVTNPAPATGGAMAQQPAVAAGDRVQVRNDLMAQLLREAPAALQSQLQPGEFLAADSVGLAEVVAETYDRGVGEQAHAVQLTLRIAVSGLAVNENHARAVAYAALASSVPPGEALITGREAYERHPEADVDAEGRVHFTIAATGAAVPLVDHEAVRAMVKGESIPEAHLSLYQALPLAGLPQIDVSPAWYKRLPWLPFRIEVHVLAGR